MPWVGGARVVFAPLFLLASWLLPLRGSGLLVAASAAWGAAFPGGPLVHALAGTAFDAAVFVPIGILFRKWFPYPQGILRILNTAGNGSAHGHPERERPPGTPSRPAGTDPDLFPTDRLDRLRGMADPADGIRRVVEGVHAACGADYVFFAQGDPPRVAVEVPAGRGPGPGRPIPEALVDPAAEVLFTRRPLEAASPGPFALVPVSSGAGPAGLLGAVLTNSADWTEPVVPMLEQGAFFIGRELDLKSGIDEVYWEVSRADGIYELVREVTGAAERSRDGASGPSDRRTELYRLTAGSVRRHLDARRVLLVRIDRDGRSGDIAWEAREDELPAAGARTAALGDSYLEWAARKGESVLVKEGSGLHALPEAWREAGDGGAILLPVAMPDGLKCVMACVARAGDEGFLRRDAQRGEQFLNVMRMGISHAEEVERLANEAQTDGLTGLLNRKTFCARLDKVLDRIDRRRSCAVIMLDIDHFKRINDGYGHPAGDEVIRTVSGVIARTVRKGDFAGRYGGEEFALYLEDVDDAQAFQAAERLRMLIRNVKYNFSGKELSATASIGVACYPRHGQSGETLLKCADEGLYRSKAGGRDRVTVHGSKG